MLPHPTTVVNLQTVFEGVAARHPARGYRRQRRVGRPRPPVGAAASGKASAGARGRKHSANCLPGTGNAG
eukprot:12271481-Alexandrium_andersonii.AAC.1